MGIRCPSESGIGTWRNECGRQTVHPATGTGGIDSCVLRTAIIPHPPSEISSCVCQGEPFPNNQLITSGLSSAVSWRLVSLTVRLFKFRVLSSSGDVLSNKLLTFQVDPQLADLLRTQMNKVATCSDVKAGYPPCGCFHPPDKRIVPINGARVSRSGDTDHYVVPVTTCLTSVVSGSPSGVAGNKCHLSAAFRRLLCP